MPTLDFPSPEQVREDFDRIAAAGPEPETEAGAAALEALLADLPPLETALDLGCGAGALLARLALRVRRVTGVDLSLRMLARARERTAGFPNVELVSGDFMTLPLAPAGFDLVASIATFHHLPLEPALERAASLVRPGGRLWVLDLFEAEGPRGFLYDARMWIRSHVSALQRRRAPAPLREAWRAHGMHDRIPRLSEVRRAARGLAGAMLHVHPLWRWSLEWRRPAA